MTDTPDVESDPGSASTVSLKPEIELTDTRQEKLEILYHDECLVIVNKPAGLLVHRSMIDRHETRFALQIVRDQIGQHVYPVHRLDKPTAGILIFALSSDIARLMSQLIEEHKLEKRYLAVVRGFAPEAIKVDHALKEKLDKISDKKAQLNKPPQQAETHGKKLHQVELPLAVGKYSTARYSLMLLQPITGRKHQLRRHMSHIRHPILGDVNHGDNKHNRFARESCNFRGLALWSHQIRFEHPVTQQEIKLVANTDERFFELWRQWGASDNQINQFWSHQWPI